MYSRAIFENQNARTRVSTQLKLFVYLLRRIKQTKSAAYFTKGLMAHTITIRSQDNPVLDAGFDEKKEKKKNS